MPFRAAGHAHANTPASATQCDNTLAAKHRFFPLSMGQSYARPVPPPPISPTSIQSSSKLRRAWAGRRKKSEDLSSILSSPSSSTDHLESRSAPPRAVATSAPQSHPLSLSLQSSWQPPLLLPQSAPPPQTPPPVQPLPPPSPPAQSPPPPPSHTPAISFLSDEPTVSTSKEDWRKSDATMASHTTVRARPGAGNRSPRPVSLAESSHSGHTIVPKRLSALITDAEFTMPEDEVMTAASTSAAALKARNRRSMSLNYPRAKTMDASLTRAAATGIIAPHTESTSNSIRGRLTAAITPPPSAPPPVPTEKLRPPPSPRPLPSPPPPPPPSFRQTAVSMTGSLAQGFRKVGRAWGGLSGSSSSLSTDSSSEHSGWKARRHTPRAPSVASSASASDCDVVHTLGVMVRGPRRTGRGINVVGGVVFRRALDAAVRESALDAVMAEIARGGPDYVFDGARPLRERWIPAIVVRCAEHLLRWGMQEEGLFRVSGRSSHVARLRSAFDTGADYDLTECDPSDLDPHAVASIFKTYLRELPESILTATLIPDFESALAIEDATAAPPPPRVTHLPLRKPPSLSTLAMPSFAGARAVSQKLVIALGMLVAQLPRENRELLLTVVELIRATAARSTQTKMPLGNLLLVFCPSLNMSPSLLRVLCEVEDIWNRPPPPPVPQYNEEDEEEEEEELPEKVPESPKSVLNIKFSFEGPSDADADRNAFVDAESFSSTSRSSTDSLFDTSLGSASSDSVLILPAARPRGTPRRGPVATLFVPTTDGSPSPVTPDSAQNETDSGSFVSARGPPSVATRPSTPSRTPAPPTSPMSSAESLATSSSMSEVSEGPSGTESEHEHIHAGGQEKQNYTENTLAESIRALGVTDTADLALPPAARRPRITTPVPLPFPSTGTPSAGDSPRTPLTHRKSFAMLSFPPLKTGEAAEGGGRRPKRPSLHLLFTRRSLASLRSSASAPRSPRNMSAPLEAPPAQLSPPPVLDMNISCSPMRLGFGSPPRPATLAPPPPQVGPLVRSSSCGSSVFSTPQQTPIADFYRNPSTSALSLHSAVGETMVGETTVGERLAPVAVGAEIEETLHDGWAESVLMMGGATG